MSDKPEPTAEEKMADVLPAHAKYVSAQLNGRMCLPVEPRFDFIEFVGGAKDPASVGGGATAMWRIASMDGQRARRVAG
jgi:hypothetical protein